MFVLALLVAAHAQECPVIDVLDCDTQRVLDAGEPGENVWETYSCAPNSQFDFAEQIWELDLSDAPGAVNVQIVDEVGEFGYLMILEGKCRPDKCLVSVGVTEDFTTFVPDPDRRYWVVTEASATPTFDIACLPAPAEQQEEEEVDSPGQCGGDEALILLPLPLLLWRRRRAVVVKPA